MPRDSSTLPTLRMWPARSLAYRQAAATCSPRERASRVCAERGYHPSAVGGQGINKPERGCGGMRPGRLCLRQLRQRGLGGAGRGPAQRHSVCAQLYWLSSPAGLALDRAATCMSRTQEQAKSWSWAQNPSVPIRHRPQDLGLSGTTGLHCVFRCSRYSAGCRSRKRRALHRCV